MFSPEPIKKQRKKISITQGSPSNRGFQRGYQSFVTDSRMPLDALSDLTNMTLDQDNLPRPRPSLVLMGEQPLGSVLGISTFIKIVSGSPEKWDISMQVVGGVGKVYVRKDGDTWTLAGGINSYDSSATVNFCQSGNRVYISNGVDTMSYYNIATGNMVIYSSLATPSAPSLAQTGLAGTNFTYYYRVTANNAVGESAASNATSQQVSKIRDQWISASEYITVTWSAVSGATSYNVYVGTISGEEQFLVSTTSLTFRDDGSFQLNPFVRAPEGNSTEGPVLKYMWNKDGQLYGVGDTTNPDYLWYDGGSTATGDFSPFNGGGNVGINSGGDTVPVAVRTFRTGKGDSAVTILSRGIAGVGKMHHLVFSQTTYDNNIINIPNVTEANGQSGTVSAMAVVEANNSLMYPTGQDFQSTGTSPNMQNILSTTSIANDILPDVQRLNLAAMDKAVGLVYENKVYWSLPVGSDENNQIWVKDLSRRGIWIMPWIVNAKFMWLSENNETGRISHCIYDGTNILEFSRNILTSDNGTPFRTRVAHEGIVWDDNGMTMAAIQEQRFKLLQPVGQIQINAFGLDEDGATNTIASETFTQQSSLTGFGILEWSGDDPLSLYSDDIGTVDFVSRSIAVVILEIDETINQLGWEVITDTSDCDYYLSTSHIKGIAVPDTFYGS